MSEGREENKEDREFVEMRDGVGMWVTDGFN